MNFKNKNIANNSMEAGLVEKNYNKMNLNLLEKHFEKFCLKYSIDFDKICLIGRKKCKNLIKRYCKDELDGNLSKEECNILYSLFSDPWGCKKLKRHDILSQKLKSEVKKNKIDIENILILGGGLGGGLYSLYDVFPKAKYFITDISPIALEKLKRKIVKNDFNKKKIHCDVLDIFNARSLFNYALKYKKFDLIVASGVFRYGKNYKVRKDSAKFIFKFLLHNGGIFAINEVRQDPKYDNPCLIDSKKPDLDELVKTPDRINPTHFVFYKKPRKQEKNRSI